MTVREIFDSPLFALVKRMRKDIEYHVCYDEDSSKYLDHDALRKQLTRYQNCLTKIVEDSVGRAPTEEEIT